jgi:hypothetical protein
MASSADALDALRAAAKSGFSIVPTDAAGALAPSLRLATHLQLADGLALPKTTPTRLRKANASSRDPAAHPGDFFTLEAVYVAWSLRDASGADYMRQAREGGLTVGFVGVTERKGVVEWIEEKVAHLPQIVPPGAGACLFFVKGGSTLRLGQPSRQRRLARRRRLRTSIPFRSTIRLVPRRRPLLSAGLVLEMFLRARQASGHMCPTLRMLRLSSASGRRRSSCGTTILFYGGTKPR